MDQGSGKGQGTERIEEVMEEVVAVVMADASPGRSPAPLPLSSSSFPDRLRVNRAVLAPSMFHRPKEEIEDGREHALGAQGRVVCQPSSS